MHKFDLEDRTTEFAKRVVRLCRALPKNSMNNRLIGQAVGSAGSVGANYREANDALGKKDFLHRLRISRKEAKELKNILSTIIDNTMKKNKVKDIITKLSEI